MLAIDPFRYITPASRTSSHVWWDCLWIGRTGADSTRILEIHVNTCSFQSDYCECGIMALDWICERQRREFSGHVDHAIQVCGAFFPLMGFYRCELIYYEIVFYSQVC